MLKSTQAYGEALDLTFSLTRESLVTLVNSPKSFHIWKSHKITRLEWNPCGLPSWPANWDMSSPPHHIASWKWFGETCEDLWRIGGGLLHVQSDDFANLFLIFYRYNMTFSENRHFMCFCFSCISVHFTATSADVTTFVLQNSALSEFLPKRYASCKSNHDVVGASGGLTWFDGQVRLLRPGPVWTCFQVVVFFPSKLTLSHWGQSFLAIGPNSSAFLLALEDPKTLPARVHRKSHLIFRIQPGKIGAPPRAAQTLFNLKGSPAVSRE